MTTINFTDIATSAIGIVPVIVALVQVAKMIGLPSKWSPVLSIGLGIMFSILLNHEIHDFSAAILNGIVFGLSASGLFSGTKSMAEAVKKDEGNPFL